MSADDRLGEYLENGPVAGAAAGMPPGAAQVRRLLDTPATWGEPPPAALDGVLGRIRAERLAGRPTEPAAWAAPPAPAPVPSARGPATPPVGAPPAPETAGEPPLSYVAPRSAPPESSTPESRTPESRTPEPHPPRPRAPQPFATAEPESFGVPPPDAVEPLPTPRELARRSAATARRWSGRQLLAAAAAAALFVLGGLAGSSLAGDAPDRDGTRVQLVAARPAADAPGPAVAPGAPGPSAEAGPPVAPGATGRAMVREEESGFAISLDVAGLPPAAPGTYYEGWVKAPSGHRVSIGTFHLRGGNETIELWAGVDVAEYSTLTVTVQRERAPATVPGVQVLSGAIPPLR